MIDKQEVLLRLACSALQGGMDDDSDYNVSTTKTY